MVVCLLASLLDPPKAISFVTQHSSSNNTTPARILAARRKDSLFAGPVLVRHGFGDADPLCSFPLAAEKEMQEEE